MFEKIEEIIREREGESTRDSDKGKFVLLDGKNYSLNEIRKEGWQSFKHPGNESVTAFVDGGNTELVKTPILELQRIRTAVVFVSEKKIVKVRQKEGYLLVSSSVVDGKVVYSAELFDSNLDEMIKGKSGKLKFDKNEVMFGTYSQENALGKVVDIVRRISELAAARQAIKQLSEMDGSRNKFVVLDGALEVFTETEKAEIEALYDGAKNNKVRVGGVAKTCSLMADNGNALISSVEAVSGENEGYLIVAEGKTEKHRATIAVVKLNKEGSHLFRVESVTNEALAELVSVLSGQSNDLTFPGYPYGLIMADRFARISNVDTEITQAKIMAMAGSKLKGVMRQSKALDAHNILDSM
jgi:hypothetical protein